VLLWFRKRVFIQSFHTKRIASYTIPSASINRFWSDFKAILLLIGVSPKHFSPNHFSPNHFSPNEFLTECIFHRITFHRIIFHRIHFSPNACFTECTFHRMYFSPNVFFTESFFTESFSPNAFFTECYFHRMHISPKAFSPKPISYWTKEKKLLHLKLKILIQKCIIILDLFLII
jgi:hypothetical protein